MRAYLVSVNGIKRFAGTQGDAKAQRDDFIDRLGVKKKDVSIEETDVPTSKAELLEFINGFCNELEDRTQ